MSQYGAARLRYSTATWQQRAATRSAIRPGERAAGFGSRYNFCIVIEEGLGHGHCALRHAYDMVELGHDTTPVHATTRRCAHGLGVVRVRRARDLCAVWAIGVCTVHSTQF